MVLEQRGRNRFARFNIDAEISGRPLSKLRGFSVEYVVLFDVSLGDVTRSVRVVQTADFLRGATNPRSVTQRISRMLSADLSSAALDAVERMGNGHGRPIDARTLATYANISIEISNVRVGGYRVRPLT